MINCSTKSDPRTHAAKPSHAMIQFMEHDKPKCVTCTSKVRILAHQREPVRRQADAEHVVTFKRTILDFRIDRLADHEWAGRGVAAVHITGSAFLWHQVLSAFRLPFLSDFMTWPLWL